MRPGKGRGDHPEPGLRRRRGRIPKQRIASFRLTCNFRLRAIHSCKHNDENTNFIIPENDLSGGIMASDKKRARRWAGVFATAFLGVGATDTALAANASSSKDTRTPIKHLIVVSGENRGFDNVFATYVPRDPSQKVWNLLSQKIVDKSGLPGQNAKIALQRRAEDRGKFQLSPPAPQTNPVFPNLPQPSTTLNALPTSPCALEKLATELGDNKGGANYCEDIGLPASSQSLLSDGGTGQSFYFSGALGEAALGALKSGAKKLGAFQLYPVPDCRYPSNLANAPYSIVGASKLNNCPSPIIKSSITPTKFTDNAGDPVHRFFQMWQQNDCSRSGISPNNPSGCRHDLYVWVGTSVGWQITQSGGPPVDGNDQQTFQGGIAMGYYDMSAGEYPYFESLAQKYAIGDNYHQPIMGGTGPNSQFMLTGDVYYYNDSNGVPATPATVLIENPDPQAGSNNFYTNARPGSGDLGNTSTGGLVKCSDLREPGVATIQIYLQSLYYRPFNRGNCEPGRYYQVDNEYPYYNHLGGIIQQGNEFSAGPAFSIGPQTIPTIGDALSAKNIPWRYYGEGFSQADKDPLANEYYCAICNGFQYSRSIMTSDLKNNLQDLPAFFADLANGSLPAVSFVKPNILVDSHPGTSTPPLFEAFVKRIVDAVQQNQSTWESTAILITFDESGGYYDSGYIQPIDFFGDGPRTVMIAVSPFARSGFVDHTYGDHASILKFIERNWKLKPLSSRSRDNLPNPVTLPRAPYFPINSPAIGDLMGMFDFRGPKR
jgi:phospholipase C